MKIVHFCAGLEDWNGMANVARRFVAEENAAGHDSQLTNDPQEIGTGVDRVGIHGAWLPVLWKVAKTAKKIGAELVIVPHGSYDPVRLAFHGWKKRLVSFFEHRKLRRADRVVVTCAAEAEWVRTYEPRAKVELTELKRFFALDRTLVERASCPFAGRGGANGQDARSTSGSLHVLYLGRRHPLKGVDFLDQAVKEIEQSNNPNSRTIDLRIVSDHFGAELERDWAWCDVLVLPTLSENFGLVIAEALERGKRVITTDGAPAWAPPEAAGESKSEVEVEQWRKRLVYLKGYRDGSDEERVELLKRAIEEFMV